MLLFIVYTSAKSIKQGLSSIVQDIDSFHVAKICQALPSTEKPKIDLAVATKSMVDNSPVCLHFIDAHLWLTHFSKGSPAPPPLMYLDDDEQVKGL